MPPRRVSSYTRNAPRPVVGSMWVWKPHINPGFTWVTDVRWNGEEWWVATRGPIGSGGTAWNDLNVFWESCHYVAAEPGVPTARSAIRRGPPQPDEIGRQADDLPALPL